MNISESYKECSYGGDCWLFDYDDDEKGGPCWGQCDAVDEIAYDVDDEGMPTDYNWVHACQGHLKCYDERWAKPKLENYIPENK